MKTFAKKLLSAAVLTAASTGAYAAGAVNDVNHDWDGAGNILGMGTTSLTATNANGATQSWTGNDGLDNAAWGHQGDWYTFHTHMAMDWTITADATNNAPAFTLYRTDGAFDGGTTNVAELSTVFENAPHAFSQVSAAGEYGTHWMTDDSVTTTASAPGMTANGILEMIGYANDGYAGSSNGFGSAITNDGNADGHTELTFSSIAHGWYVVFVGGAQDIASAPSAIDLNISQVSAVPVPAAVYLFGSALVGLFASSRRKITEA